MVKEVYRSKKWAYLFNQSTMTKKNTLTNLCYSNMNFKLL